MNHPVIQTLTPLAKTRYLSMYDAHYTNPKGNPKHWMIATRKDEAALRSRYFEDKMDKPDAVVLVAYHRDLEALVLIRQWRIPINAFIYELPAGLIDDGETVAATVMRELKEETGLSLISTVAIKEKVYLSAGMTDESVALVYCTCEGDLSTDYLEPDECIEPFTLSKEAAKALLASDAKIDIKTYLVVQQFVAGELDYLARHDA